MYIPVYTCIYFLSLACEYENVVISLLVLSLLAFNLTKFSCVQNKCIWLQIHKAVIH